MVVRTAEGFQVSTGSVHTRAKDSEAARKSIASEPALHSPNLASATLTEIEGDGAGLTRYLY